MTKAEGRALVTRIRSLLGEFPAADASAAREVQSAAFSLRIAVANSYFREKVSAVESLCAYWFTARRWRQYGEDPGRLRGLINNALANLESVVDQYMP